MRPQQRALKATFSTRHRRIRLLLTVHSAPSGIAVITTRVTATSGLIVTLPSVLADQALQCRSRVIATDQQTIQAEIELRRLT